MKRIVYKISGESLKEGNTNISNEKLQQISQNIKKLYDNGLEIVIICGGGNLWRGRQTSTMNNVLADKIGMLATSMNSLAIYDTLKNNDLPVKLYNSFLIDGIINTYDVDKCLDDLNNKHILIIGGGSGLPLCTTDFACVQRAIELQADTILLGKSVDGIYNKDPKLEGAKKFDEISRVDVLKNHINCGVDTLGVMDITSEALLAKYDVNALLFDANDKDSIIKILDRENVGTIIK